MAFCLLRFLGETGLMSGFERMRKLKQLVEGLKASGGYSCK